MHLRKAVSNKSNKGDQNWVGEMVIGLKVVTAFASTLRFISQNPYGG